MRSFQLLLLVCLVTGSLRAASDPFIGKWKLDPSKSKLTDVMKVDVAGANRYALTFGPGAVDTVTADGSDQPGIFGTTLSISVEAPDTWKVVRKKDDRTLLTGVWKLSKDGNTLSDAFTANQADGSKFTVHYVYNSGFPGTWESVSEEVNSVYELQIQPYEDDGLSFINPAQQSTKNIKFDGRDYANLGPNVAPSSSSSARRVNERNLEMTDKIQARSGTPSRSRFLPISRL